jgi:glycosyltransferase involved in cell wall biosynthesis
MVRLLALVPKPPGVSPGQRFRLEQWAPYVEAGHGIRLDFVPFESPRLTEILYRPGHRIEKAAWMLRDTFRRRVAVAQARRYDGVVIYREGAALGPAIYERLLARASVPILFDFDDAIWIPAVGSANGLFSYLRFVGKTATICRLSSAVIVGNQYLASYARRYSDSVFVVPTSIDLSCYPIQPGLPADAPFTIVWSGSLSTLIHLERARAPLEALGKKRRVVLRIIGNEPPLRPFAGIETQFVTWRAAGEAEALGAAHVGIMPLPDDPFARGKCGLKGLQYMAVGLPVVLSPVGVNVDIVEHGRNGLLASTVDDWVSALEKLADSPDLRRRLGAAGRRTVDERFSARSSAARFAEAVHHALSKAGRRMPDAKLAARQKPARAIADYVSTMALNRSDRDGWRKT